MEKHHEEYAPFVLPQSIDQFVNNVIRPYQTEIENVGLSALFDVLLKPASIGLEVIYLDLSPGSEANVHTFEPAGPRAETLRLLYRP